ncbi:MAG: GLUG motif-containing protein, partial [Phycisphaerales bacterium]
GHLDKGVITNCYAKRVIVTGGNIVGGLVGSNDSDILECYTTGIVSGNLSVGGLVGQISEGTVKRCYSKASVSGNRSVGGLAGITVDERSEITNSYAAGSVEGDTYVGGLAGQVERGNAYKCYSTSSVSGNRSVGGFVGNIRFLGTVSRCLWDTQSSGQPTDPGGTGKTTEEMKTISTFTSKGWDFLSIWTICEGINYPVLLWQIPAADYLCPDGVNFIDYASFASHWERNNCNAMNNYCNGADLNQTGSVDFRDLEIFAEKWLEGLE